MKSLKIYYAVLISAFLVASCNSLPKEKSSQNETAEQTATETKSGGNATLKNLSSADYQQLTKKDKMVLVDFNAVWCGPCKALKPSVDNISEKYKAKGLTVLSVDVDSNEIISNELHIQSIPLLMLYKNGELVWKSEGLIPQSEIEKHLN